jgi:hypothetical protein
MGRSNTTITFTVVRSADETRRVFQSILRRLDRGPVPRRIDARGFYKGLLASRKLGLALEIIQPVWR